MRVRSQIADKRGLAPQVFAQKKAPATNRDKSESTGGRAQGKAAAAAAVTAVATTAAETAIFLRRHIRAM